jgi:GTP cyclohydrolase II
MRFQALMPDVLHWLGIQKIDRMMVSFSYAPSPNQETGT